MLNIISLSLGPMPTNCYIVYDESSKDAVIFDPAYEAEKIIKTIEDYSLNIKYIFLTHGHFDHIMALEEIRDLTGAKLFVGLQDNELITDPRKSYVYQYGGSDVPCRTAEVLISGGENIPFGEYFITAVHTPGHTAGSVCYIIEDNIFSGDTLFKGATGRYDLYSGNLKQLRESMKWFASLEGDYKILPAHGDCSTLDFEKKTNPYLNCYL